ncbi:hypothetical protein SAY87_020627 [Trapa incisa]|uniref:Uncharacterized protein n=1 Tax=Trapa incisa TaxID=236973 RepID=A0AAN7JQ52_9MYRT|nr:hypothetical protein SAY87_020627 [Trapa incisa]
MGGRARVFILAPALLVFLFLLQSAQAAVHHYTFVLPGAGDPSAQGGYGFRYGTQPRNVRRNHSLGTPFADTSAPYDTNNVTAIFRYRKATRPDSIGFPTLPGATNKTAVTEFTDQLRSLASTEHPVDVPKNITKRVFITVSVNQIYCANESCGGPDGNRLAASLSNISFVTPTIDILQAYYR